MTKQTHLLRKHKKHYFSVFYGVHIKTIESIKCEYLGVKWVKIFSKEFDELISQIPDFENSIKEELDLYKFYHAHELSCLFYAENEKNLTTLYNFLILLRPSRIREWLTFDTYYSNDFTESRKIFQHQTNGYSIWTTIHELHDDYKEGDLFHITTDDFDFVNKLLKSFSKLSQRTFFKEFFTLYRRAYFEEKDYFKFLLYFMVIESFIKDDDTAGVVYKIRRLCAVLVGTNITDCEMIFNKTRDAYYVRSSFVHKGKNEVNDAKYLPYIGSIASELGILILISNLTADNIFKISNQLGYGQKQTLIKERNLKAHTYLFINWLNFISLDKKKKK